ncbi:haloacid dehalogenase-like hydrolase [Streptomyces sp. NPDC091368]|uniref:haloacid dehalogenase-like hydrolase n=1 Tax=Streptomyces sp. NPDC091368 TaxID=3365993 RepID=UPI00382227ED
MKIVRSAAFVAALVATATCAAANPSSANPAATVRPCPELSKDLAWYGDNREALQDFIDENGSCSGARGRLALFDWDNTVIKNDVGDATTFWMLRNGKVRQPSRGDWTTTSRYLTQPAATALKAACGPAAAPGRPLPTGSDTDCADEILSVYSEGETTAGDTAFSGYDHRRMEPSYAWAAQLLSGYSADEVKRFARQARAENLAAPEGTEQRVGTKNVTGWARYYPQQKNLISTLQRAGFDVRIVSASAQPVVEVWAEGVGLGPQQVTGVKTLSAGGRLTPRLADCGGAAKDSVIPYIEGKRCFVNQNLLHVKGADAFRRQPASQRQVFGAGDSDTDVTFVGDATKARLVLNRNKPELMCRSYFNSDGKWLVNPMFIGAKPQLPAAYPCSTAGFTRPDGAKSPVVDTDGRIIPDQQDRVF